MVKNEVFSPLLTICAHIWYIFKFRNAYSSVLKHSAQTRLKRTSFPGKFCVLTAVNMLMHTFTYAGNLVALSRCRAQAVPAPSESGAWAEAHAPRENHRG